MSVSQTAAAFCVERTTLHREPFDVIGRILGGFFGLGELPRIEEAYQRLSPHPDHFNDFLAMLSQSMADTRGWPDEQLATITAPALLVLGDRDFTTVEHGALMQQLIPGAQLAILPGTTHMQVTRRADLLLPMLTRFLD
jgi:pimeloyl-ACP methyl ester carboxylesterase